MTAMQVELIRRLLYPDTTVKRISYDVPASAKALGVTERRLRALLHDGQIPSQNTGKRYLISGGTLLDILGCPHPDIHDHRDPSLLDPARLYTRANLCTLLGVTAAVGRGFVESGRIEESEAIGYARYIPGTAIAEFLAFADEPMREAG